MRKLSAYYVFPISSAPLPFGIIETEDDGTIARIVDTGGRIKESSRLEFYPGILIPGIVYEAIVPQGPNEACRFILNSHRTDPGKPLNKILRILTWDAAMKISKGNSLGSLETGKKPGIQWIDNLDLENMMLTEKSTLRDLIAPGY